VVRDYRSLYKFSVLSILERDLLGRRAIRVIQGCISEFDVMGRGVESKYNELWKVNYVFFIPSQGYGNVQ
jgi:hypothetical protein